MGSISGLSIAVSGLNAAQMGLMITGHNTANVHTPGFTRQMHFQHDFFSRTLGPRMQAGLGTAVSGIFQIRCRFLDMNYRQNVGRMGFHDVRAGVGEHIETIMGELEGGYRFQEVLFDLHEAVNELMKNPGAMETRGNFIAMATSFIRKADDARNATLEFQRRLNDQVIESVRDINVLANQIDNLNRLITRHEAAGDNANDFRDQRNLALDQLSALARITHRERASGAVDVLIEGRELVVGGIVHNLGLRRTAPGVNFVEPVFTHEQGILSYYNNNASPLFTLNANANIVLNGDDFGFLKGLLVTRGSNVGWYGAAESMLDDPRTLATWETPPTEQNRADLRVFQNAMFDARQGMVPRFQTQFDTLVNSVVNMFNNFFAYGMFESPYDADGNIRMDADGNPIEYSPPFDQHGNQSGIRLFQRMATVDADGNQLHYTTGNIEVNPLLVNPNGWALLPLSLSGDESDPDLMLEILRQWDRGFIYTGIRDANGVAIEMEPLNVNSFYRSIIVGEIGIATQESREFFKNQVELVTQLENFRLTLSGVALDEEMTNMMRFQHSYNAAARILNVIDSMIDRVINHTGRAGL